MPKVTTSINSFTAGEFSPKAKGRYDLAKYSSGVGTLENFLINQLGGASFRPGFRYIAGTKYDAKASRLLPFQYSADLDYVMEMGDEYMRFFANDATTIDAAADWDSYYMLMLHGDGTDLDTNITDEKGKTVTNNATFDTYTKVASHFDGADGATAYTDPARSEAYTFVGTAQLDTAQKMFGSASLLLDGNSDYVTLADHADWNLGSGVFAIEARIRVSNVATADQVIVAQGTDDSHQTVFFFDAGNLRFLAYDSGGNLLINLIAASGMVSDIWYHVAVVRSGNTFTIYVNGTAVGSAVANITLADWAAVLQVGAGFSGALVGRYFGGWIDELRISKGIARWTTTFTSPVAPYGQVTIDTGVKKFGTGSLVFDGGGSVLSLLDSADWNFGTGDWSIDGWVYFNAIGKIQVVCGQYEDANNYWFVQIDAANKLHLKFVDGAAGKGEYIMTSAWSGLAVNTWYHIEFCRSTTSAKIFINGVSQTLTEVTAFSTNNVGDMAAVLIIGAQNSISHFEGHLEEFRINKGIARHTSDFSVPTSAYEKTVEPLELVSPYDETEIFDVYQAHKNDIKYLTHGDYAPRKVSRTSLTVFAIALADLKRGPFLDDNITTTTITPSAATGTGITLTASASLFDALHVGSYWRIAHDATHDAVVKITAVNSATEAIGDVQTEPDGSAGNIGGTGAYTTWAEGAFSAYRGYPKICCFHDGRLYYANTDYEPQKVWGSVLYAYDNFDEGAAADSDAITFEIASEDRSAIKWLISSKKSLMIGTIGGTYSASGTTVLTPDDIQVTRDTNYGVAAIAPKRISSFIYFIQRNLHKLRELSYYFDIDAQRAMDMNLLAEHILRDGDGAVDLDHQQSPNDRIWVVRDDGQLAVLTRNPEQEVMGWSRLIAGEDAQGAGVFESVVAIPKQEADDQIWVIVKRVIGGTTKRFIEVLTPEEFDDDWDAVRVDCSLTLDSPKTITAATKASPVVITSASHGFSNGDQVKIDNVVGMTQLNGGIFLVANKADNTFELTDLDGVNIDGTAYSTYISGGEVRKMVTAISGLSHLEGETVTVQADGEPLDATYVVTAGMITLAAKAAVVHVGLPYEGTIKLLKLSDGSATGTGQGKMRRIHQITFRLNRTQGLSIGRSLTNLDNLNYNEETDPDALFTGDLLQAIDCSWDRSDEIIIKQEEASPANILCLILKSEVEEG